MSQARNWCFTLNNPSSDDLERFDDLGSQIGRSVEGSDIMYLIIGKETCPTTGTPHIQGYIQFNKRKRLGQVRNLISTRSHCEVALGTPTQNLIYCKKEDDWIEWGQVQNNHGMPDPCYYQLIMAE